MTLQSGFIDTNYGVWSYSYKLSAVVRKKASNKLKVLRQFNQSTDLLCTFPPALIFFVIVDKAIMYLNKFRIGNKEWKMDY